MAYAAGPTVILTLPTNERRQYTIKSTDPVKFYDQNGKEITVFDLRKNMKIKATKITEAPRVELVQNIAVTGTAPTQAAAAAPAAAAPKPAAAAGPARGGPGVPDGVHSGAAGETPKTLPKTASPLPLLGLIGIVSLVAALGLTVARRR